jgi:dolichyl-phosphate beta-glucosyltransferase
MAGRRRPTAAADPSLDPGPGSGGGEAIAMRPDVSLVIAAYNGGADLERSLTGIRAYFDKQPYPHEVIVVDDGSTDATGHVLDAVARDYPQLTVVHNTRNSGKGYAIRTGVLRATGRFIFFTDADVAYPLEEIEAFLPPLWDGTHTVVVGSRVHRASMVHLHPRHFRYLYRRHLMSRFFNYVARASLGIRVMDTQCGFKGFEARAAHKIFSRARIAGFAFDVEVLLIAQRLGCPILELPVKCVYDSDITTVRIARHAAGALRDLARIYLRNRRGAYREAS